MNDDHLSPAEYTGSSNEEHPPIGPEHQTSETKTFEQLLVGSPVLEGVRKLGFVNPTPVQASTIPLALTGRDLVVEAQTGSGKTLAFVIPLLARMLDDANRGEHQKDQTYGLILAPTRELALQNANVIRSLTNEFTPVVLIGGTSMDAQGEALSDDQRIVVATPGRALDFLRQKRLKLNKCRYFVLDEADEMLSMGFLEDVRAILSRLPDQRQGLFVSATITPRVDMIANSFLTKPEIICIENESVHGTTIEHLYAEVGGDLMAKPAALCDIIETFRPNSAIIFCNTKSDTHTVEAVLRRRGFDARRINSDLTQAKRNAIMKRLRARELQFLVATDIAARGIDISQIDLVVNFSIHDQPETYIHRTGRTGRAGRHGKAISLVGPRDFGAFHFITKIVDFPFTKIALPSDEEICNARLAHVYELLRQSHLEPKNRDLIVARKLLSELGNMTDPSEELVMAAAKLQMHLVEHHVAPEATGLDEDDKLEAEARPAPDHHQEGRERNRGRERGRDRDGEGRGRGKSRDDRRNRHGNEHHHERASTPRDHQPRDNQPENTTTRLYVGQGSAHGLTDESLRTLVESRTQLSNEISHVNIRENYSFVDVTNDAASNVVDNLNGTELNGQTLVVERATSTGSSRRRGRDHQRNRHRRGEGRNDSER